VYESCKSNIDSHFKLLIQNKRDELSSRPADGLNEEQNAQAIAEAFTSITNEHARVLQRLRQSLDAFMDREVHSDLQKATHTLSYQHGVRPEVIIDLIVNGPDSKQASSGPQETEDSRDKNGANRQHESIQYKEPRSRDFLVSKTELTQLNTASNEPSDPKLLGLTSARSVADTLDDHEELLAEEATTLLPRLSTDNYEFKSC
jgi:hypothetical protein